MSSALCRVAIEIVEPATNTGSSTAYGVLRAGAPDVDLDLQQLRVRLLRREFERGRPARELGRGAEPLAQREVGDLDHDAVGVELELRRFVVPRRGRTR